MFAPRAPGGLVQPSASATTLSGNAPSVTGCANVRMRCRLGQQGGPVLDRNRTQLNDFAPGTTCQRLVIKPGLNEVDLELRHLLQDLIEQRQILERIGGVELGHAHTAVLELPLEEDERGAPHPRLNEATGIGSPALVSAQRPVTSSGFCDALEGLIRASLSKHFNVR
uniref:CP62b n=1 Tax=Pseudomonas aeruginosa TaxID=287 RepID=Q6X3M4_PSEAI|nr:CP62b [Pseudomonas aeruginosa]